MFRTTLPRLATSPISKLKMSFLCCSIYVVHPVCMLRTEKCVHFPFSHSPMLLRCHSPDSASRCGHPSPDPVLLFVQCTWQQQWPIRVDKFHQSPAWTYGIWCLKDHSHQWRQYFFPLIILILRKIVWKVLLLVWFHPCQNSADCSLSPVIAPKKPRVSDQGASEDWDYLLSSEHHGMVSRTLGPLIGLAEEGPSRQWDPNGMEKCEGDPPKINHSALLYPHVPSLMFALHLVYEVSLWPLHIYVFIFLFILKMRLLCTQECKLDSVLQVELQNLALLLLFLAKWVHLI